jgi:hypothetical protein
MANSNFGTGFYVSSQARVIKQVSDRQVTAKLRVTRIVAGKNQPIGGTNEDGSPKTKLMTIRVDFKNLDDSQVAQLTVGSLIQFEGEIMEERFQAGDDWVSFNIVESWGFHRVATSKAEREAAKLQVLPPVKRETADVDYDEIAF